MKIPRKTVIEQIIWHIEHEEYIYYGNKEQFRKRREEALEWLKGLTPRKER